MLREIIFLNGVYDLACAASHLLNKKNALTKLHGDLFFKDEPNIPQDLQQRLLAYWILTYGIVRLAAIAPLYSRVAQSWECMVASNYFVEAVAYALEGFVYRTVDRKKAAFVSATSSVLGMASLYLVLGE